VKNPLQLFYMPPGEAPLTGVTSPASIQILDALSYATRLVGQARNQVANSALKAGSSKPASCCLWTQRQAVSQHESGQGGA
jgi:hypothetical protein